MDGKILSTFLSKFGNQFSDINKLTILMQKLISENNSLFLIKKISTNITVYNNKLFIICESAKKNDEELIKNLNNEIDKLFKSFILQNSTLDLKRETLIKVIFVNINQKIGKNINNKYLSKKNTESQGASENQESFQNNQKIEKKKIPNSTNIILILSGKGGVGKSTVSFYLAKAISKLGYKTSLLDLDIYGPTLHKMTKIKDKLLINEDGKFLPPVISGIKIMSVAYFMENDDDPITWRGPMLSKMIQKMICDTDWRFETLFNFQDTDFLIIDTPPGTGDIHISLMKEYNITPSHKSGTILVSTPNDIALQTTLKTFKMQQKFNIPCYGIVENMSYIKYKDTNQNEFKIRPFGEMKLEKIQKYNLPIIAKIPISEKISNSEDIFTRKHLFSKKCMNDEVEKAFENIAHYIATYQNKDLN